LTVVRRGIAVALVAVIALWTGGASVSSDTGVPQDSEHVILISIDGFAAYHLDDPSLDLPNIRALAASGIQADSSETVFPSVTHPSHTTLVTGVMPRKHGVVNNTVTDRRTGQRFHITSLPRQESVLVPTIFDVVKAAGGTTASFFWPETKDDPAIDVNIAEVFHPEGGADPAAVTPGLLDELRQAGVPIDTYYDFYDNPYGHGAGDIALTEAADRNGALFGDDRIEQFLAGLDGSDPEPLDRLTRLVRAFEDGQQATDDMAGIMLSLSHAGDA